jgi:hypothetical protein
VRAVFPPKEYKTKDGRDGTVATVIIGDDQNQSRLVLWGRHSKLAEKIGRGARLRVINAYVKEGMRGIEIHVNKRTRINVEEEGLTIPMKPIADLVEGMFVKTRGSVRKILREASFRSCQQCGHKGDECPEHGPTQEVPVINCLLDDGWSEIRGVFFGEKANAVIPGIERYFVGKTNMNDFTGRLEITVHRMEEVSPREEVENLLKQV